MATSLVSSIIFFLLFFILFVDGKVFAAQMEHRKLGGAKETMTMRRNLEQNGRQGSKMATPGSTSPHSGQRNTENEPSRTYPDQTTVQGTKPYLSYVGVLHKPVSSEETMTMRRNLKGNGEGHSKIGVRGSTSPTAGGKTAKVPVQSHPNQAKSQMTITYDSLSFPHDKPSCKDSDSGCIGAEKQKPKCPLYVRCNREIGNYTGYNIGYKLCMLFAGFLFMWFLHSYLNLGN